MEEKLTPKIFLNKVLAGTATGIIVGLIPNAVLAAILKLFGENTLAVTITQMAVIFQLATPLLIGALIAVQFGFKPMQMLVVAGAAFVGSGVVKFNPDTATYIGAGTGDIINTMITASIAVGMILLIGEKFGSVAIVATPIVVGIGAGLIGYYLYPYVTKITAAIGDLINTFTTLQPILMSILIACSFAFLIISPISTVAIGMAIQLNGVSAGFGLVGLVGPLASLDAGLSIILLLISWFVVPIVAAFVGQILFEKILKLYDRKDVFEFLG